MYEMDKQKFGAFVAQLRKEKNLTQMQLAEKLYISNKAVSKWETGVSIPDVGLLVPLAEALEVSVTELLQCQRLDEPLSASQVEDVVKQAITYSEDAPKRTRTEALRHGILYLACLAVGALEALFIYWQKIPVNYEHLLLILGFGIGFGYYFMFIAKPRLPRYYDENRINGMIDGPFRMNIPGVRFTNSNWPHIVRWGKIWSMGIVMVYPALLFGLQALFPEIFPYIELYVLLALLLGGLFIPLVILGRKYE